jgi:hypothetical protein
MDWELQIHFFLLYYITKLLKSISWWSDD